MKQQGPQQNNKNSPAAGHIGHNQPGMQAVDPFSSHDASGLLALPGALQRQTAGVPAVQRVKAVILEDMPKDIKDTIELLNMMEPTESYGTDFMKSTLADGIKKLEKSAYREHCKGLIDTIKPRIPLSYFQEAVALESHDIHSIWVQGDYEQDEETLMGVASREKSKATEWRNLIWVYSAAQKKNPQEFKAIDGMVCRPIELGKFKMLEVGFIETMQQIRDKPKWVERFLPLLEILLAKKSYVTMSDIMRMIILHYKGGLYMDVKIQLTTPDAQFFDEPLVNTGKLQLVQADRKENWAMVAEAGCKMIEEIMEATLKIFPDEYGLERLPENYKNKGEYSQAHKTLHEQMGPWSQIDKRGDDTDSMSGVNPSLKLKNPRPVNSWAHDDGYDFNWDRPSPWRQMAENIRMLPPHNNNLSPQHVLFELTRDRRYDQYAGNFWAAYDAYRAANRGYTYNLSPVQVINRLRGASPTRLYIMYPADWDTYRQFKLDHPNDFVYFD